MDKITGKIGFFSLGMATSLEEKLYSKQLNATWNLTSCHNPPMEVRISKYKYSLGYNNNNNITKNLQKIILDLFNT